MKNLIISIISILLLFEVSGQPAFNNRYDFGLKSTKFQGMVVGDSSIFISGLGKDTISPFNINILQIEIQFNGAIKNAFYNRRPDQQILSSPIGMPIIFDSIENVFFTVFGLMPFWDSIAVSMAELSFSMDSITVWHRYPQIVKNNTFGPWTKDILSIEGKLTMADEIVDDLSYQFTAIKLDSIFELQWNRHYGTERRDLAWDAALDVDGRVLLTGYSSNEHTNRKDYSFQELIYFIDPGTGDVLDEYRTDDTELRWPTSVLPVDDGYIVASKVGEEIAVQPTFSLVGWEPFVYKMDRDFNELWRIDISSQDSSETNYIREIIPVGDGAYVGVGFEIDTFYKNKVRGTIFKVTDDGELLWKRYLRNVLSNEPLDIIQDELYDIAPAPDGGFYLCGTTDPPGTEPTAGWLMKVDSYGCLVPGCHLVSVDEENNGKPAVLIGPNPVGDFLNIYLDFHQVLTGRVYDMQGRLVTSFTTAKGEPQTYMLPAHTWPAGMYVLSFYSDGELVWSEQVVKL